MKIKTGVKDKYMIIDDDDDDDDCRFVECPVSIHA